MVEADVLGVIRSLNFEEKDISDTRLVLNKIIPLASKAKVISFSKCPRAGNQIAHFLVRAVTGSRRCFPCRPMLLVGFLNSLILPCWKIDFFCRDGYIPMWLTSLIEEDSGVTNSLSL